ncbi:hypothetical protein PIB30_086926 [Stylosanthes scabra]|uniref:Uncharacterized protein n=1 Tax=Stylosanthes scabra TaxID=79078 RepID=A0ABU6TU05_9FABA|nr:hypothetical protein [Stylosanthes scabra]
MLGIYSEESSGAEANRRMSSWPAIRARNASYLIAHLLVNVRCISRLIDLFVFAFLVFFTMNIMPAIPYEMGSGVIYYEYEKREKFEDYDLKADAELRTFKIRRYHFDNESFFHPLHSVRFDPDSPYEVPIEASMADQPLSSSCKGKSSARGSRHSRRSSPTPRYSPRRSSSTRRVVLPSPTVVSSSLRHRVAGKTLRLPKSWELIPPSEGWMCEGDKE